MVNISSLHTSATLTCITESIIRPDCSSKTICVVLTIGVFGCKQVSGVLCLLNCEQTKMTVDCQFGQFTVRQTQYSCNLLAAKCKWQSLQELLIIQDDIMT